MSAANARGALLDAPPTPLGESIGRYEVDAVLGKGSMGTVYLGHDEVGRKVAIKVLSPEGPNRSLADGELVERFEREGEAYRQLDHEGIVRLHDSGVTLDGRPYLVMEHVTGSNLQQHLQRGGALEPEAVAGIGQQVARALHFAHQAGFVHRDVKPANVMLDADGNARLTDFGIARTSSSNLTRTAVFVGSLTFSSPEQVQVEKVDGRSDLFALGVTLYLILTRFHPFARAELGETLAAIRFEEPPPPSLLRPELTPAWDAVLSRAMAKAPADRYPSGEDLARALAPLADPRHGRRAVDRRSHELVVVRGPDAGKRFPVAISAVIGREDSDVSLTDPEVSSRHCRLDLRDGRIEVRDLGSGSGTWLNGKKVESSTISTLTNFSLGPQTLLRVVPRVADVDEEVIDLGELRRRAAGWKPRRWLVAGLWPAGATGTISGPAFAGKTLLALDLAVAVAGGTRWLGGAACPGPGPAVLILPASEECSTFARLEAIATSQGCDIASLPLWLLVRHPGAGEWNGELLEEVLRKERPALVVLDPVGLLGEAAWRGAALASLDRRCREIGATLLVVAGDGETAALPLAWGRITVTPVEGGAPGADEPGTACIRVRVQGRDVPDRTMTLLRTVRDAEAGAAGGALEYVTREAIVPATPPPPRAETVAPAAATRARAATGRPRPAGGIAADILARLAGAPAGLQASELATALGVKAASVASALTRLAASGAIAALDPALPRSEVRWRLAGAA